MDREAWRAVVHGVEKESDTTERLNWTEPNRKARKNLKHWLVLFTYFEGHYAIMYRNFSKPSSWQAHRLISANQNAWPLCPSSPSTPPPRWHEAESSGLRLCSSRRGRCACAPRPDWLRADALSVQAAASVTEGGSPARALAVGAVWGSLQGLPTPAMPNRRASRNAYYFFVQEKIPELRRRGLPVARVADAIPYCSPDWAVRLEAREPGARQLASGRARREGKRPWETLGPAGGGGSFPSAVQGRPTPEPPPGNVQASLAGPRAPGPHCCVLFSLSISSSSWGRRKRRNMQKWPESGELPRGRTPGLRRSR